MAKRYKTHLLKKHLNYSVEQTADFLGVHPQTVRGWEREGLRFLKKKTPHLILGIDMATFLDERARRRRRKLRPNELYCLACKSGKIPAGFMADFIEHDAVRGRLSGICPNCESMCHRLVRKDQVASVAPNLAVMFTAKALSLEEPDDDA